MSRRTVLSPEEAARLKKHLTRLEELLAEGVGSLSYAHASRHYLADLSSRLVQRSEAKPLLERILSLIQPGSKQVDNNKEEIRQTIARLWKLYRLDALEFRTVEPGQVPQGEKR